MAFDDSDDIKINISVDTEAAIKATQDLKVSIETAIKATAAQFDQLQKASKQLGAVLQQQANNQVTNAIANSKQEVAIAQQAANEKVAIAEKAIKTTISAEQRRIQELKVAARQEIEIEKTKRTQMLKDIAQLNKERAIIQKTPRAELPPELGGATASGKALKELGNIVGSVSTRFGFLSASFRQLNTIAGAFGPIGKVTGLSIGLIVHAINKLNAELPILAEQAGRLEGLRTGFETLQRSLGQNPEKSIQALRVATQGLITDTELYQKANQAVLLNVPTKVFNEAAGAAVKLGRAMGIDAGFALESLSLGLGRQSRLYLDNLGIVVSAEEAYQKFALANNKVASQLTDSEKRAAFYAEALEKIRDRAAELPDVLDTVGVAQTKVQVAQDNVNAAFLNGLNQSRSLSESYQEQAKIISGTTQTNELWGRQLGYLGSIARDIGNSFYGVGVAIKGGLVEGLDLILRQDPVRQLDSLEAANRRLAESVAKDSYELAALKENQDGNASSIERVSKRIEENTAEFLKNRQAISELRRNIVEVRDEANNPIKVRVDLTEILQAQQTFQTFISGLRADILEQGNEFNVPGISKEALDSAGGSIETLVSKVIQAKGSFAGFEEEFKKIEQTIAFDIQKQKVNEYANTISALSQTLASTNDKSSAFYKETQGLIAINTAKMQEAAKAAELTKEQEEALQKVVKNRIGAAKKANDELIREEKRRSKEAISAIKKQDAEWGQFLKSLKRGLNTAIDPDIQKRLAETFRTTELGSDKMLEALKELGKEVQKRKGDLAAFQKEAAKLADIKAAGGSILDDAATSEAYQKAEENLKKIQSSMLNLRELFTGEEKGGGGFFGFNILGKGDTEEIDQGLRQAEGQIADSFQNLLATALQAGLDGFSREDVPAISAAVGSVIGMAIGGAIGGAAGAQAGGQIGGMLGQIAGQFLQTLGVDKPGARERKAIDKYFAELFDGERLAVVIQGQLTGAIDEATGEAIRAAGPSISRISDLVFEGMTPFAGAVDFGGEGFTSYFETLSSDIQASFDGIGLAFGTLNGVAAEQARLIGVALANNIGGSLQNLQVLIQATGTSLEDLANSVLDAFLNAQLSIDEAYNSLAQLQTLYQVGLPDAVGDFEQASKNLLEILRSDRPGRYAIDSLRDIGAEGIEAGKSFQTVIATLGQTFGFTAQQQTRLFEALRLVGLQTLGDLKKASDEQLLAFLKNIETIRENADGALVGAPVTTSPENAPRPVAPRAPSKPKEKTPQEIAAELLKKQREEARKLLLDSQRYSDVLNKINEKLLSQANGGQLILRYEKELLRAIIKRDLIEKQLNEELDKGTQGNARRIAKLGAELERLEEFLKKAGERAKDSGRQYKELDISGIIPLIKSQNELGVVANQVGVNLQKNIDILVKGFLQGRLSIEEVNDEIKKTKDLLGPGIPGAVGAVTEAFQNLIDAGTKGGAFSVDAFTDIFAEFREKFKKEGSELREAQRQQLNSNLDAAKEASRIAVGPEAAEAAKKALDAAKKALDDFRSQTLGPDIADLRQQLLRSFDPADVEKFFRALDESGLNTFEDFEGAGDAAVIGILGRLKELGFNFKQTSGDISGISDGLQDAEKKANAGLDPLQAAIDLVKQFNQGAAGLPPVFNETTSAISELNVPLAALSKGFDDIIEKLAKLNGQTFENNVVFNIKTIGDQGGRNLVELIFGDGTGTGDGTGNGTPPPSNDRPRRRKRKNPRKR